MTTQPDDLSAVTAAARRAQADWSALDVADRLKPIRALRRLLVAECDRLCAVIGEELGKPPLEVLGGEVLPVADALAWLERRAAGVLRPRRVGDRPLWLWGQSDTVHRRSRGVVAIIGTWNYPLLLNAVQTAQALVAGNAVVWKPSEVVPRFAGAWVELMGRIGLPAGLFQALPATREMGPAVAEADVDHVVFTGSAAVGRHLAARLGERLVSSTLELSGCDVMILLDDADLKLAARAAWFGLTMNRSQTCVAPRRVFVPRARVVEFASLLRGQANDAPLPLATPAQVRQARELIDDALGRGARLLIGPGARDDALAPTVLLDMRPEMALCHQAAFAPVLGVLPYDDEGQLLADEAACPFALGASIFTASPDRARALAARLRAGMVSVNDVIVATAHPATPFGGRGHSGWGVTQGAEGLLEMTVPQVLSVRAGTYRPHLDADDPKAQATQARQVRGLLEAGHAATLAQRLRGWWRVVWG